MDRMQYRCLLSLLPALFAAIVAGPASAAESPPGIGGEYRADTPFPEFMPMWREGWAWKDENGERVRYAYDGMPLGGYVFACFRNSGNDPLAVRDVLLEGVSLAQGIAPDHEPTGKREDKFASSLQFSKLAKEQIEKLVAAGEPVWWKVEPMVVPPGGYGQVTIRLRRQPRVETLTVIVPSLPGVDGRIAIRVTEKQPRFFSVNFSPDFRAVYAYLRHPSGKGIAPRRVLVDGRDMTDRCTIVADESVDTVPVIIRPASAFKEGTWYSFQAVYADSASARVCMGAWQPGFVYGMWGYSKVGKTEDDNRTFFLEDMRVHNINTLMYSISGEVRKFLRTKEGQEYSRKTGIRVMTNGPGDAVNPPFYYLPDEPDANDFASKQLDPHKRIGSLGQWVIGLVSAFRRAEPGTPVLLNTDNTFKPENWYTYAQLPDLPCADPYYQESVQSVWACDPGNLGAYVKPTYVYGVGTIYQSAGAPKPMHLILHTCRMDIKEFPYRAPTPEEKRVEVYYALAAGAKALSYWWYTPFGEYYGCGGSDKASKVLWRELGLIGAELRPAEAAIIRSCPAAVSVKAPRTLWVRSLLVGDDAMALIIVNANFASDRVGTVVRPLEKARIQVQPPSWLKCGDAFELTYEGTRDVKWQAGQSALTLDLGAVQLTRFVWIAKTPELRRQVQKLYETRYADNAKALLRDAKTQ